jgi:hypothetical protein
LGKVLMATRENILSGEKGLFTPDKRSAVSKQLSAKIEIASYTVFCMPFPVKS